MHIKTLLVMIVIAAAFANFGADAWSCNDWKKMDGRCPGCVFTSGDMAGKCKRTGKYFDEDTCVGAGGTWCG